MDSHWYQWICMDIHGYQWICMDVGVGGCTLVRLCRSSLAGAVFSDIVSEN